MAQPHDGRDAQRAGQNGAVGVVGAQLGTDAQHALRIHPGRVRRCQVGGDEDRRLIEVERRRLDAHEPAQYPPAHILDVGRARPHVLIFHGRVLGRQRHRPLLPGRFGVERLGEDQLTRGVQCRRVLQEKQMGVEDGRFVAADLLDGAAAQRVDLPPGRVDGRL